MAEETSCLCGYNPYDLNDQCYCPHVPTSLPRRIYPIRKVEKLEVERIESLGAYLAEMDLLTPG